MTINKQKQFMNTYQYLRRNDMLDQARTIVRKYNVHLTRVLEEINVGELKNIRLKPALIEIIEETAKRKAIKK
jgi:hypothetical protein